MSLNMSGKLGEAQLLVIFSLRKGRALGSNSVNRVLWHGVQSCKRTCQLLGPLCFEKLSLTATCLAAIASLEGGAGSLVVARERCVRLVRDAVFHDRRIKNSD